MISSVLDQRNLSLSAMRHILQKQTDVETEVLLQFDVKVWLQIGNCTKSNLMFKATVELS